MAVRAKGTTVRQVLTGTVFLNFHHLHPEFQKFILHPIQTVYNTKKEVQSDVTFFLIVSVSALVPTFLFVHSLRVLMVFPFALLQQFLSSTMSVFWGLGINCLID